MDLLPRKVPGVLPSHHVLPADTSRSWQKGRHEAQDAPKDHSRRSDALPSQGRFDTKGCIYNLNRGEFML